jgi:hypothetical protein
MKKLIYLIVGLGLFFTACNPMDEIYTEIDAQANPVVGDATYTLTGDDYTELGLTDDGFSSFDEAKTLLPAFLTDKYPTWGKGSSVLINLKVPADGVSDYTTATTYQLANTDYPGYADNGFAFYPSDNIGDLLPTILDANVNSPVEGQKILVKYKKYTSEPVVGVTNYFNADFSDGTLGAFTTVDIAGPQTWAGTSYGAKMSGYSGGAVANEDWLISPEIDLTNQTNASFTMNQAINYASGQLDLLQVLVSTDYTNDVNAATWDVINLTNTPPGTNWTFVQSDDYDFSAYDGQKIHIAFKYQSTDTVAATWEILSATVKVPGVTGDMASEEVYYNYNGSEWVPDTKAYPLQTGDYDSMGEASGQPGKYNNFDSSMDPDTYIATFLNLKYPYANNDDQLIVTYKYYSGSTGTRGNLFTVIDGVWTPFQNTLQFGHDGTTWVPDNTIKYTLVGADYIYISDQLTGNADFDNVSLPNLANYGDFDYNWSEDQILYALGVLADHINPSAEEGQKYLFTYLLYDNGLNEVSMHIIKENGVWVLFNN